MEAKDAVLINYWSFSPVTMQFCLLLMLLHVNVFRKNILYPRRNAVWHLLKGNRECGHERDSSAWIHAISQQSEAKVSCESKRFALVFQWVLMSLFTSRHPPLQPTRRHKWNWFYFFYFHKWPVIYMQYMLMQGDVVGFQPWGLPRCMSAMCSDLVT